VLPAVPPIPKAPGTLLPAFDSSSSSSHLGATSEASSNSTLPSERRELAYILGVSYAVFCHILSS